MYNNNNNRPLLDYKEMEGTYIGSGPKPLRLGVEKRERPKDDEDEPQLLVAKRSCSQILYSSSGHKDLPLVYPLPNQRQGWSTHIPPLAQRQHGYSMIPPTFPSLNARPTDTNYESYAHSLRRSPGGLNAQAPSYSTWARFSHSSFTVGAKLNIIGDLSAMSSNWTGNEKLAHRRLVEFSCWETGDTIKAVFNAVSSKERTLHRPCISCIYWEKKGQWYVTSVDTIALLEALVATKFTVEEKNRIRRNLESFNPYSVSKANKECNDLYELIMGFPSPKPRTIEKDIKVFLWKILDSALKKVISKYAKPASYALTSSVIGAPTTTAGYRNTLPNPIEHAELTVPRISTAFSNLPSIYPWRVTSTAMPPSLGSGSVWASPAGFQTK